MAPIDLISEYQECYARMVGEIRKHVAVKGLILSGSRARGLAKQDSDTDLTIVFKPGTTSKRMHQLRERIHSKYNGGLNLDLGRNSLLTLTEFKDFGRYGTPSMDERYALVSARLEFDNSGGQVAQYLRGKQSLDSAEVEIGMQRYFPHYLQSVYRSVRSALRGHARAALLDAAASIEPLLGSLFTLHHRVVPYNKFLEFELATKPLPAIQSDELLEHLDHIITRGAVDSQKKLYRLIAGMARETAFTPMIDAWHGKLALLETP